MTQPLTPVVWQFLHDRPVGVLATQRPDGTPRQSVVYHLVDGDRLLVTTEGKRAKARDVRRTGRASYCVTGDVKPFPHVTVEGAARILTQGIAEPTSRLFAVIFGGEPPELTDEQLADMDRVILELVPDRVTSRVYLAEPEPEPDPASQEA